MLLEPCTRNACWTPPLLSAEASQNEDEVCLQQSERIGLLLKLMTKGGKQDAGKHGFFLAARTPQTRAQTGRKADIHILGTVSGDQNNNNNKNNKKYEGDKEKKIERKRRHPYSNG